MRNLKIANKVVLALLGMVLLGGTLVAVNCVQAVDTSNGMSSLVQKIAQKFGLKKADVQAVFDADRQERQAQMQTQMQAKLEEQLSKLVSDGKITEAQKTLILEKHKELQAQRQNPEDFRNLTAEQRKTQMETQRKELEDWAKQNNIDIQYLWGLGGLGIGKGHGGFWIMGRSPIPTPTP